MPKNENYGSPGGIRVFILALLVFLELSMLESPPVGGSLTIAAARLIRARGIKFILD
jgi:hypothetical protein